MAGAATLNRLAREVARLAPDRHDPEALHAAKSEIAAELAAGDGRWVA